MFLLQSVILTMLLMAQTGYFNHASRKINVVAIIEEGIQHVRALEVIQFLCRHTTSSRIELVFETHNLTSNHPAFMDGQVGPLLGENVQFILWVVTCQTLDFLPQKVHPVSAPSIFLTVEHCSESKPYVNTGLKYVAIADIIQRLKWSEVNIIYDNSLGVTELLSIMEELSERFVKSSLYAINSTSADYKEKIFAKFISLNQKSLSPKQFLVILKNETLGEVIHLASILHMTIGKSYWIFIDDNLEPEELVEFGINPRNANMLLFRSACDGDGKDVRKADELVGDLQRELPKDHKYILPLICMVMKSLKSEEIPDLHYFRMCTKNPADSMSDVSGILMVPHSPPSNSCYPAFEVSTIHKGFANSIATTIARWRPDTNLIVKDDLFPNRKYGLGNAILRVSTVPLSPYITRLKGNSSEFKGLAVQILEELSLRMNFSYEWQEPADEQFGMLKNDSFTGLVGQLEKREVDLVVAALTVSYSRSQVVDYCYPYTEEGRGMLIKKATDSSMLDLFKVFRAFKATTWLSFAVVVVVVSLILTVIDGFKRISDSHNTIRGMPDNRTAKNLCLFSNLSWKETLWSVYTMHLFQGGAHEPTSSRSRVIIMCWWLFTILISTYYTANLTANFTVVNKRSVIESLSDLANSEDILPITLSGSAIYDELKASDDPIKQKIFKRLENAPFIRKTLDSLELVKSGKYVMISLWSDIKAFAAKHCKDVMVTGKPYGIKRIAFASQKGSALNAEVSKMLGIMKESGLIDKWRRGWWKQNASCLESDDHIPKTLDMNSLGGVYIVFAVFTIVACILLALEIMNHKQNKRKRISLDDVARY